MKDFNMRQYIDIVNESNEIEEGIWGGLAGAANGLTKGLDGKTGIAGAKQGWKNGRYTDADIDTFSKMTEVPHEEMDAVFGKGSRNRLRKFVNDVDLDEIDSLTAGSTMKTTLGKRMKASLVNDLHMNKTMDNLKNVPDDALTGMSAVMKDLGRKMDADGASSINFNGQEVSRAEFINMINTLDKSIKLKAKGPLPKQPRTKKF
jgi:hypothetical protein